MTVLPTSKAVHTASVPFAEFHGCMRVCSASWCSLWSRWCFCWLIPASPHACLTTQSSSLLASCPNQFICKQVCFFPLRPIVHTTPECIHNGRPLSPCLSFVFQSRKHYVFTNTHSNLRKLGASLWPQKKFLKCHYYDRSKGNWHLL